MSALGSLVVKLALEYAEYTQGLDKSSQESLRFAQNAQKSFDTAAASGKEFFVGMAQGAVAAVAAYVSVGAVIDGLKNSIDSLANLDDMSQKTGASVENLSRLQKVAAMTGAEFGTVDSAIGKLAKGMATVDSETSKVHKALKALGVSSTDAAGKMRDPSEVMIDVAKNLQNYKDGAGKTALANDLLGKSGADLLPYLNDVAENVDKFAGVSTEATQRASELQDKMGLMRVKVSELFDSFAVDLLPTFIKVVDVFTKAREESQKLAGNSDLKSWGENILAVMVPLANTIDNVVSGIQLANAAVLKISASRAVDDRFNAEKDKVVPSNFLGMRFVDAKSDAAKKLDEIEVRRIAAQKSVEDSYESHHARILAEVGRFNRAYESVQKASAGAARDKQFNAHQGITAPVDDRPESKYRTGNTPKDTIASIDKEAHAYANLITAIKAKTEENKLETLVGLNATESQKMGIKLTQELASGKVILSVKHIAAARAALVELDASEKLLKMRATEKDVAKYIDQSTLARKDSTAQLAVEYQLYGQSNDARAIAMIAIKEQTALEKFLLAEKEAGRSVTEDQVTRLNKEAAARTSVGQATLSQSKALGYASQLRDENKKFNAESIFDEKDRARALLQIDAGMWQERIKLAGDGTEAQKNLQTEYGQWYANQLNKPAIDEWRKSVAQYDDVFRKGFADMVNGGRGAWKSFTTSLVTTFKTTVADQIYKMFAQPFVVKFVASMLGIVGGGAAGVANAATGGGTSVLGSAGGSAISSALTNGVTIAGSSIAAIGSSVLTGIQAGWAGTSIAGAASAYGAAGMTGVSTGLTAGSAVGTALAAIPVWGWAALAAITVAKVFGGRGEKKVTGQGIEGTFGADGFAGNNFQTWKQDGGWFHSDRDGKRTSDLDGATAKQFSDTYATIKSTASGMAIAFGLSADSIADYSRKISLQLTSDDAKNKEVIAKAFSDMGDDISTILVPNIANFAKENELASATLARLSGSLTAANQMLDMLNVNLYEASVAGGDMASKLVDLFGSLEAMQKVSVDYFSQYYSEQEKVDIGTRQLSKTFADLGFVMPAATEAGKAQLRAQIESELARGEAGQKSAVQLMGLSGALSQLADATTAATAAAKQAVDQALSDAKSATDDAMRAVERSITAEKSRIGVIRDVAAESVSAISGVFDLLKEQISQLYGTVSSTSAMQAAQGNAFIDSALLAAQSTGYMPDANELADAIAAARGGLSADQFATQFEADKAALVMAGKLSQIKDVSGYQLTAAEKALQVANDQLSALDAQLEYAQQQVDALNGINASILSLKDALAALASAKVSAVSAQRAAAPYQAPPTSGSGAGGAVTVSDLYTQALGRAPDAEGLAFWTSAFGSSVSSSEAASFFDSAKTVISQQQAAGTWDAFQKEYYPSFDVGINRVPYDMTARIHADEAIVPAAFNPFNPNSRMSGISGGSTERLERLVEGLTDEVKRLQAVVADGNNSARQLADQFDNVTEGGNALRSDVIKTVEAT